MGRTVVLTTVVAALLAAGTLTADAQCCLESCGAEPPWNSCANGTSCTGGVCDSPIGSAVSFTTDVCGTGSASGCPTTEVGQCTDGVNNDVWTGDSGTDCSDPDCAGDPVCVARAPVAGRAVLAALTLTLTIGGAAVLRRRAHG